MKSHLIIFNKNNINILLNKFNIEVKEIKEIEDGSYLIRGMVKND
jgi:hypothetical protein